MTLPSEFICPKGFEHEKKIAVLEEVSGRNQKEIDSLRDLIQTEFRDLNDKIDSYQEAIEGKVTGYLTEEGEEREALASDMRELHLMFVDTNLKIRVLWIGVGALLLTAGTALLNQVFKLFQEGAILSWSDAEELRIATIETLLNQLQIAVSNLAAKQQIRQLLLLKQSEIDALTQRVADLERMVALLEEAL